MKLKGNSGISLKNISILTMGLGAVLLILRIYQSLALTDGQTGFFTENNFSTVLFYIIAALTVLVPTILCFVCSDLPSGELRKKPSFLYIFSVIFFAAALLVEGVKKLQLFFSAAGPFALKKEAVGGNIGLFLMIFSLLSVVSLLLSLVLYVKDGTLTGKLKIPMLFPVIWAFLKTLGFFSVTVSYIKVVNLLLTIFAFAFIMVFLFENARVSTGIGRRNALWFFFASGLIGVALCFSAGIPTLIAHFFAPDKEISYCPYDLTLITAGLYALTSVLSRIGVYEEAEVQVEDTPENTGINDVTENG